MISKAVVDYYAMASTGKCETPMPVDTLKYGEVPTSTATPKVAPNNMMNGPFGGKRPE